MNLLWDGRTSRHLVVVLALLVTLLLVPPKAHGVAPDCSNTSVGLTPLTDLTTGVYEGERGGLYPNGENTVPEEHLALGLQFAQLVVPRGEDGRPSADGSIGLISIGVSNTRAMFDAFARVEAQEPPNPALVLVNGAQSGRALGIWASERAFIPWQKVDEILADAGLSPNQVQVAWVMLPPVTRGPRTIAEARSQVAQLAQVVKTAKTRYPNLVLAFMSSRAYGGYIPDEDSEPNAYLHGYTAKWLIEAQIEGRMDLNADPTRGPAVAPWIAWGPYLWADGTTARSDDLVWMCEDFAPDGVHPGPGVEEKVSKMLLHHFSTDPTAAPWFNRDRPTSPPVGTPPPLAPDPNPTTSSEPTAGSESVATTIGPIVEAEDVNISIKGQNSVWQLACMGLGAGIVAGALVGLLVVRRAGDRRR